MRLIRTIAVISKAVQVPATPSKFLTHPVSRTCKFVHQAFTWLYLRVVGGQKSTSRKSACSLHGRQYANSGIMINRLPSRINFGHHKSALDNESWLALWVEYHRCRLYHVYPAFEQLKDQHIHASHMHQEPQTNIE